MQDIILLFTICILCLSASSCAPAPPENDADELELHRWELKTGTKGSISFDDGTAVLDSALYDGSRILIRGKYYTDESTLTIVDDNDDTLVFGYDIVDNSLELEYVGMTLSFIKSGVKE